MATSTKKSAAPVKQVEEVAVPTLGIGENIRVVTKAESKIKAFFDVIVPTVSFGDITIRGFKLVQGQNGYFISIPNKPSTVKGGEVRDPQTGQLIRVQEDRIQYYNDILLDSTESFNKFRAALESEVMPIVIARYTRRMQEIAVPAAQE